MGYNYNCYSQYCTSGCCDYWGYCPSYSSSCYYYYSNYNSTVSTATAVVNLGAIIGGAVGGFIGLVITIVTIVYLVRRFRQNQIDLQTVNPNANNDTTMIIMNDPKNNPVAGQPQYNQPIYNNNYSLAYNQPAYQTPMNSYPQQYQTYSQPYNPQQPAYLNDSHQQINQQPIMIAS